MKTRDFTINTLNEIKDKLKLKHFPLRFKDLSRALNHVKHSSKVPVVVAGDDGRFWVTGSMEDANKLLHAGYKIVK